MHKRGLYKAHVRKCKEISPQNMALTLDSGSMDSLVGLDRLLRDMDEACGSSWKTLDTLGSGHLNHHTSLVGGLEHDFHFPIYCE